MITVRDLGRAGCWYIVAAHYPSALQAKAAWELLTRKLDMRVGDEGIGVMRLSPPTSTGMPSGAPLDVHSVVGVTLHEPTARKMERLVRDGTAWEVLPDFGDALIARRVRLIARAQAEGHGDGRIVIRRPEGRGAELYRTGELREPEPGRG